MRQLLQVVAENGEAGSSVGEEVTFWICATLCVAGALGLIFSRKTVHSALSVAVTMISLAVLFIVNDAPFRLAFMYSLPAISNLAYRSWRQRVVVFRRRPRRMAMRAGSEHG